MDPMPPVKPREPCGFALHDYLESFNDWVNVNQESVEWFLENHKEIQHAIELVPMMFNFIVPLRLMLCKTNTLDGRNDAMIKEIDELVQKGKIVNRGV